jgi:acetyl esterase/lipase
VRQKPGAPWRALDSTVKQPGLHFDIQSEHYLDRVADILGVGPDGDTLWLGSRVGSDRFELAAYSMTAGRIVRTIARLPQNDLTSSDFVTLRLLFAHHGSELLGMVYEDAFPHVAWLNPHFAALQRTIDHALPGRFNCPIDWTDDGSTMIYLSSSDQDAGTYYAFRPARRELIPLLQRNQWLAGRTLAKTVPFHFRARDGQLIPAYLTRPAGSGPAPLIVSIHGGPMARDGWGFNTWNQFFASRGYLVLQVNYRGSSGYGAAFQRAGLDSPLDGVVLDDIADGVKYLIRTGQADPRRVAVAGASFGGWATYMSLIKYPDLYQAGVAISAVSDWRTAMRDDRWLFSNRMGSEFLKSLLRRQDALGAGREIEPVLRASELRQPILIVHGGRDTIVNPREAQQMLDALKRTNSQVFTKEFPDASHSDWPFADQVQLLDTMATFLERHLPGPAGAGPAIAAQPAAATREVAGRQ